MRLFVFLELDFMIIGHANIDYINNSVLDCHFLQLSSRNCVLVNVAWDCKWHIDTSKSEFYKDIVRKMQVNYSKAT